MNLEVMLPRVMAEGLLIAMAVPDIRKRRIPVLFLALGAAPVTLSLLFKIIAKEPAMMTLLGVLSGITPGIMLILAGKLTGKVGAGDGIVIIMLGVIEGWRGALVILAMSCLLLSLVSIVLLTLKKVNGRTGMPFVPAMCAGYLIWMVGFG